MKRIHVKGNSWVLEGPQLVGLYQIDESTCLLLDPGSTKLQGEIEAALEKEGEQILRHAAGKVYPLCIEGKAVDSPGLAKRLAGAMQSPGAVRFVIGSSHGLSPRVKAAGEGLSMSPMTFPHQLARVMLCEQIYRGFQILGGTKYHK